MATINWFLALLFPLVYTSSASNNYWFNYGRPNYRAACTQELKDELLIIENHGHPKPVNESKTYLHDVKLQPGMAGLRVRFIDVNLARTDFVYFFTDGNKTQPNCGNLSKFQTTISGKGGQVVTVAIGVRSQEAKWKIEVQQIKEENVRKSVELSSEKDNCGKPKEATEDLPLPIPTHPVSFIDPVCSIATVSSLKCRIQTVLKYREFQQSLNRNDDDDRIINGENAKRGSFPWMVALFVGPSFFCGGTVVSKHTVLTAGHCASTIQTKYTVSQLTAVFGSLTLNAFGPNVQILTPDFISFHPQYSEIYNDIAALHFKEEIKFNDAVSPVCLPSLPAMTYENETGYISGWGKTSDTGSPSTVLQHATIPISNNTKCKKAWDEITGEPNNTLIFDNNICAGGQKSATCNGDSGGPLQIKDNKTGRYLQVGVVSFGPASSCLPKSDKPLSVFARVTSFLKDLQLWTAVERPAGLNPMTYVSC